MQSPVLAQTETWMRWEVVRIEHGLAAVDGTLPNHSLVHLLNLEHPDLEDPPVDQVELVLDVGWDPQRAEGRISIGGVVERRGQTELPVGSRVQPVQWMVVVK